MADNPLDTWIKWLEGAKGLELNQTHCAELAGLLRELQEKRKQEVASNQQETSHPS